MEKELENWLNFDSIKLSSVLSFNNQKSSRSQLEKLIDELTAIDMEIADPLKPALLSNVFGESYAYKQKRKELRKALINRKCMLINTCLLPTNGEELLAFVHLTFSSWQREDNADVKSAWKDKVVLASNRLRTMVSTNAADHIADEFLYLSEEISKAIEVSAKKKRGFFG